MKIYCTNPVFKPVTILLNEYYGNNPAFDKHMVFFGYNLPDSEHPSPFLDMMAKAKSDGYKVIIYQLEQLFRESYWVNPMAKERLQFADEIWEYDYENIGFVIDHMHITTPIKFRPMLYSNAIKTIKHRVAAEKDIDILYYGGSNKYRASTLTYIQKNIGNHKITFIQGVWGKELDDYIARAKIVLNIHFFPDNRQEQVRMFQLVSNGCCVVSEFSEGNHMGNSIINANIEDIPSICRELLRTGKWEQFGKAAEFKYKELTSDYFRRFR